MAGRKYQVKYVDNNGTTQVLAQHRTNNTDPNLDTNAITQADRILVIRQHKGFDKAKVWCDPNIIGNVPIKKSNYSNAQNSQSEPEILIEEWTGSSWDTIFRGFAKAKPSTSDDGQALFILKGFGRYTGKQDTTYDASGTTQTIDTILQNILPSGYTVDIASASSWPGGSIPTIEDYSLKESERQIGYREIARNYDASIQFTSDLSGADYVVRLEPEGEGGTVDTIYSAVDLPSGSDTLGLFREWEGENTEGIVNKVRVIGDDGSGNTINVTRTDSTSISEYGVKFKQKNIPYLASTTEAQNIGDNLLNPDPKQGGVVKTPRYTSRVVNSSFELEDSNNNVSAVFTAVKTRNYLHEQATELVFEFETGSEAAADNQVETVYERTKVYPDEQTDVGGQTIDQGQSNTTTAQSDISTSENDQSPDVSGDSDFDNAAGQYNFSEAGASLTDGSSISTIVTAGTVGTFGTQIFLATANFSFDGSTGDVDAEIQNTDTFTTYFNETFSLTQPVTSRTVTIMQSEPIDGDTIELEVTNNTGSNAEIAVDLTVDQIEAHRHGGGNYNAASHNHNVGANDAGHGDTTDPSTHELQGQTEDGQNINTATEDKTDR